MKTILTFSGRIHHWQRLSPIVNELRKRGHDAPYFVIENATQNDPASEYLIPAQEQFIDASAYLSQEDISRVTENAHKILSPVYGQSVSPEQDVTAYHSPFWLAYSIREANENLIAFRNMFLVIKPDIVLGLHEANYFVKSSAYLCHEMGIPHVIFQEGRLRARDQQTQGKQALAGEYSDLMCVWSESARQIYVNSGISEHKIVVTGIPHMDFWFRAMQDQNWPRWRMEYKAFLGYNPSEALVTFALPLLGRYEGSPQKAIGALVDWSASNFIPLALRFHPFEAIENVNKVKKALADGQHQYARVIEDGETIALLAVSDLAISQQSTVAVESIAMGTPLAEIDLDNVGVLESLADAGVAHYIREGELGKIKDILSKKAELKSEVLEAWIDENIGPRDGLAVERVVAALERLSHG